MIRVVTIVREYGSGGATIAQLTAELLGSTLAGQDTAQGNRAAASGEYKTAQRYHEHIDSWLHRKNRGGLWHAAVAGGAKPLDLQFLDPETVAALAQKVITRAADENRCVIVRRGAPCVLQGWTDVLQMLVCAPWMERVGRVRRSPILHASATMGHQHTERQWISEALLLAMFFVSFGGLAWMLWP